MTVSFKNPANGYIETGYGGFAPLWCFLFGPFYFVYKGNWRHAILFGVFTPLSLGIAWFVYPFLVYKINHTHYMRQGWIELPAGASV